MDYTEILAYVLTAIFGVLALFFGVKYGKAKELLTAVVDLLDYAIKMPEGGITAEEIRTLKEKAKVIQKMFKELIGKE